MGLFITNVVWTHEVDCEPKKLIHIINDLKDADQSGVNSEIVKSTLQKLLYYVRSYFAIEEQLMNRYCYPNQAAHLLEHDQITKRLNLYNEQERLGESITSSELIEFLDNWMDHHILIMDKQLGEYLSAGERVDLSESVWDGAHE
jgi:hemerythrin